MLPNEKVEQIDRHALVSATWIACGFVAVTLIHYGLRSGGPVWILSGFVAALAGFVAHIIANAVLGTDFSPREVAVGLVAVGCAVVATGISALLTSGPSVGRLFALAGGLAGLSAAAIAYMVIRYGIRDAFEKFNVVRNFNPRPSSRLPHKGGRR
jgi:hypothetical protein